MKNYVHLNVFFITLMQKVDFTVKKKLEKNFDNFSAKRYDISGTVGPILIIFSQIAGNFIAFLNNNRIGFKKFPILREALKFKFSPEKMQNWQLC